MIVKVLEYNNYYKLQFEYILRDLVNLINIIPGSAYDKNNKRICFIPKSKIGYLLLPFKVYNIEIYFTSRRSALGDITNIVNTNISLIFNENKTEFILKLQNTSIFYHDLLKITRKKNKLIFKKDDFFLIIPFLMYKNVLLKIL